MEKCAFHLPGFCDCGTYEEEELVTMADPVTPPASTYKPPASEEEEHERFTNFLGKFLEEDDDPTPTSPRAPASSPAPSNGSGTLDIDGAINRALDAREGKQKSEERFTKLEAEIVALKTAKPQKKWYQPWTLFEG
jgi:hypothetical protein